MIRLATVAAAVFLAVWMQTNGFIGGSDWALRILVTACLGLGWLLGRSEVQP